MLKIGDQVIVIENKLFEKDYSQTYCLGKTGIIIEYGDVYDNIYLVEFDGYIENDEGDDISKGTFFDESELKIIPKYDMDEIISNLDKLENRI